LIKNGDKVGASEATLLNMLNISPFSYGLTIKHVFENGTIYSPDILDITPEDIRTKFTDGVRRVAAVSLAIGYPTLASVPHSIANGFKKLMAVAAATEIEFEQVKGVKEYLKDPSKFASAAPVAAAATDAAPVAEKKKEKTPEPSSDEDMGFGLFD
jgi:large subunit ribosomal protein LP0